MVVQCRGMYMMIPTTMLTVMAAPSRVRLAPRFSVAYTWRKVSFPPGGNPSVKQKK